MAKGGPTVAIVTMIAALIVAGEAAISCSSVTSAFFPCAPFVLGSAAQPSQACCNGIRSVNSAAKTTADRQAVCNCVKNSARSVTINFSKASKLPGLCGVHVAVPIGASTNCAAIH